jgi:hypothetical protein
LYHFLFLFPFVVVKFDIHSVWVFYLNKNFVAYYYYYYYLCVLYIFIIKIQLFFLLFFISFYTFCFQPCITMGINFQKTKNSLYFFQTFKIICILFVLKYNKYHTKRLLLICINTLIFILNHVFYYNFGPFLKWFYAFWK